MTKLRNFTFYIKCVLLLTNQKPIKHVKNPVAIKTVFLVGIGERIEHLRRYCSSVVVSDCVGVAGTPQRTFDFSLTDL